MINRITSKDLSSYDIFKDDKIKQEHNDQNKKNNQEKELDFLKELRKRLANEEKSDDKKLTK